MPTFDPGPSSRVSPPLRLAAQLRGPQEPVLVRLGPDLLPRPAEPVRHACSPSLPTRDRPSGSSGGRWSATRGNASRASCPSSGLDRSYLCINAFAYAVFRRAPGRRLPMLHEPSPPGPGGTPDRATTGPRTAGHCRLRVHAQAATGRLGHPGAGCPVFEIPHPSSPHATVPGVGPLARRDHPACGGWSRRIQRRDAAGPTYGTSFKEADYAAIPRGDLPFGLTRTSSATTRGDARPPRATTTRWSARRPTSSTRCCGRRRRVLTPHAPTETRWRRLTRLRCMTHVLSAVAWPYANGPRHIGHVAGFGVPSDVFSRYMRMAGHDVLMVSGTDEHGTPILVAADAAGRDREGPRGQEQRRDRAGPRRPRPVLRPLHPDDDGQPLPRRAGDVHDGAPQRLHGRADHARARSARRPGAPCPTATSRAPARSAGTPTRAATSATTAATSSTRPT